jgi:hypothetical protein
MAQELRVDITVDDKGSMVVKRFGQSAEKSMAKVERSAKAARKSALKLKLAFAGLPPPAAICSPNLPG